MERRSAGSLPSSPTAQTYCEDQTIKRNLLPGAQAASYQAYIIKSFGPDGKAFKVGYNVTKPWHGDPMAALNRAFTGLTHGYMILPANLITLHRMYQDNDLISLPCGRHPPHSLGMARIRITTAKNIAARRTPRQVKANYPRSVLLLLLANLAGRFA